jgi:hypothetical protein
MANLTQVRAIAPSSGYLGGHISADVLVDALLQTDLTAGSHWRLVLELFRLANGNGVVNTTVDELARLARCHRRIVAREIQKVIETGMVRRLGHGMIFEWNLARVHELAAGSSPGSRPTAVRSSPLVGAGPTLAKCRPFVSGFVGGCAQEREELTNVPVIRQRIDDLETCVWLFETSEDLAEQTGESHYEIAVLMGRAFVRFADDFVKRKRFAIYLGILKGAAVAIADGVIELLKERDRKNAPRKSSPPQGEPFCAGVGACSGCTVCRLRAAGGAS